MKKIVVYSMPNCPQCEFTKRELVKLGVEFEVEDLMADKNNGKIEEFKSKGFRGAPITIIGETIISGFNPMSLRKALNA